MHIKWKVALSLSMAFLLAACGSNEVRGGAVVHGEVNSAGRICYAKITDGRQRSGPVVAGSGLAMTVALRDELIRRQMNIMPLEADRLASALTEAAQAGCDKVLFATITEWQDYATEWSWKGDSVGFSAELYRTSDRRMLSSASFRKKASAFALVNNSPDRFASTIASATVSQLFGTQVDE